MALEENIGTLTLIFTSWPWAQWYLLDCGLCQDVSPQTLNNKAKWPLSETSKLWANIHLFTLRCSSLRCVLIVKRTVIFWKDIRRDQQHACRNPEETMNLTNEAWGEILKCANTSAHITHYKTHTQCSDVMHGALVKYFFLPTVRKWMLGEPPWCADNHISVEKWQLCPLFVITCYPC